MRELSLFSGVGGGLLGSLLLGWTPIGYVEINEYCQRVIAQRITDGVLPVAPIFTDVREFVQSGAAAQYRGFADVVSGGFPCQPFSQAGKRKGADDERNMWPATIDTLRAVRPRYVFLENVPGLLWSGYFGRIVGDLAESGYDCRWRILSAAEVGAPHKRDRLWIVGHSVSDGRRKGWNGNRQHGQYEPDATGEYATSLGDTAGARLSYRRSAQMGEPETQPQPERSSSSSVAHPDCARLAQSGADRSEPQVASTQPCGDRGQWWAVEPDVGRVAHGVVSRVDRLRAIGNGQIPLVAATAWHLLTCDT